MASSLFLVLGRWLCVPGFAIALLTQSAGAEIVPVKIDRWLQVSQAKGKVTYTQGSSRRNANPGDRLQNVGDGLATGKASSSTLLLDSNIGTLTVGDHTALRVQALQIAPEGGRISRLYVSGGRVRLKVRKFTNPSSRLEIDTPAGVSGVRGTEFGVSVQPDGKTSVATLEGTVVTSAQGQDVEVNAGFQTLVIPGEPPLPPTPLTEDTRLRLEVFQRVDWQHIRMAGHIDRFSMMRVEDQSIATDRTGQFDVIVPLPLRQGIQSVVVTPLGKQQVYEIAVP
jgi:FecR protein